MKILKRFLSIFMAVSIVTTMCFGNGTVRAMPPSDTPIGFIARQNCGRYGVSAAALEAEILRINGLTREAARNIRPGTPIKMPLTKAQYDAEVRRCSGQAKL